MASTRINMRLPEELDDAVSAEAAHLGLSKSEFVRQWMAIGVATNRILTAIENGADPKDLRDPGVLARLLGGIK